jgi:hypothetical protein
MLVYPGTSHFTTAITIYIVILVDIYEIFGHASEHILVLAGASF